MKMLLAKVFNQYLDRPLQSKVRVLDRSLSAFQFYVGMGLVSGSVLTIILVSYFDLSPWVMIAIIVTAVLTFFAQAMLKKIVTGVEDLVYYRDMIVVILGVALMLRLLNQPVLPYLDVTLFGVSMFQACGRIGCLMVGCCHGRPHAWGVRYDEKGAASEFPKYLIGVRLFPIQVLESFWLFCVVLPGMILVLNAGRPGEAFSWYILAYGTGRFFLEFARSDIERPYLWSFSEGQWTSLLLVCALALSELSGLLVFHSWHVIGAGVIAVTMILVAVVKEFDNRAGHKLLLPSHIREVALAIEAGHEVNGRPNVKVGRTSLGVLISTSQIKTPEADINLYTLSSAGDELTENAARAVARLLLRLRPSAASNELIRGGCGVFHLLVRAQTLPH